jgi:hypothetical protein
MIITVAVVNVSINSQGNYLSDVSLANIVALSRETDDEICDAKCKYSSSTYCVCYQSLFNKFLISINYEKIFEPLYIEKTIASIMYNVFYFYNAFMYRRY